MLIAYQKFQLFARRVSRIQGACFREAIVRQPVPEVFRFVELDQRLCKVLRLVRYEDFFTIPKFCSIDRDRSCHHWYAKGHALIDFAFHPGPKSQRRHGQFYAIEKWSRSPLQSCYDNVVAGQSNDLRRRFIADNVEFSVWKMSANQRVNALHKKQNGIDVRRVLKATDEQPVSAKCERRARAWHIDNV